MKALASITAAHVRAVVTEVAREGVPAGRGSTKFCLVIEESHYPPKYILGRAASRTIGRALRPDEYYGGVQTNSTLHDLGFSVVPCRCGGTDAKVTPPSRGHIGIEATPARSTTSAVRAATPAGGVRRPTAPATPLRTDAAVARATVLRVVTHGRTPDGKAAAERILLDVFGAQWPKGASAKFVITPGGFVHGSWPREWRGTTGWASRGEDVGPLIVAAERQLASVVTERVLKAAVGKADVLTIGIDLMQGDGEPHVELVAVFDLSERRLVRWTGKSYPTPRQERTLVHFTDLGSHFLEIADERVLVLGCHDLNMFSPRGRANQRADGVRRTRCDDMKRRVARFKPTVVLQHPHSTDTPNIWRLPWMSLAKETPSIRSWASGIAYFAWNGGPRSELERVLDQTAGGDARPIDLVIRSSAYS